MKEREQTLRIGEVAQQAGLTVEALRYYERMGLLPHPPRSNAGLRRYRPDVLDRVRFIKQAQTLGLSLKEIQHGEKALVREKEPECPTLDALERTHA